MGKFKNITHWVAAGLTVVAGFAVSPAGQAVIAQYPKLAGVTGLLSVLAALYHDPKAS